MRVVVELAGATPLRRVWLSVPPRGDGTSLLVGDIAILASSRLGLAPSAHCSLSCDGATLLDSDVALDVLRDGDRLELVNASRVGESAGVVVSAMLAGLPEDVANVIMGFSACVFACAGGWGGGWAPARGIAVRPRH